MRVVALEDVELSRAGRHDRRNEGVAVRVQPGLRGRLVHAGGRRGLRGCHAQHRGSMCRAPFACRGPRTVRTRDAAIEPHPGSTGMPASDHRTASFSGIEPTTMTGDAGHTPSNQSGVGICSIRHMKERACAEGRHRSPGGRNPRPTRQATGAASRWMSRDGGRVRDMTTSSRREGQRRCGSIAIDDTIRPARERARLWEMHVWRRTIKAARTGEFRRDEEQQTPWSDSAFLMRTGGSERVA